MTTTRSLMIYWGGQMIQIEYGPTVTNAYSRLVNFSEDFDFVGLQHKITEALGITNAAMITKILFRHPVIGYGRNMVFGFMEIRDVYNVGQMFEMVRQFPGWVTIELYVEISAGGMRYVQSDEARTSNSNRNELENEEEEEEEDACVDEEEDNELDDDDEELCDADNTDEEDEKDFFDEDDDYDGDDNNDDDVYDDNNNDDVMIRLVEGLNREVTPYLPNVCSQFECVNIKEMHVNQNPSNVENSLQNIFNGSWATISKF